MVAHQTRIRSHTLGTAEWALPLFGSTIPKNYIDLGTWSSRAGRRDDCALRNLHALADEIVEISQELPALRTPLILAGKDDTKSMVSDWRAGTTRLTDRWDNGIEAHWNLINVKSLVGPLWIPGGSRFTVRQVNW